jgi:hypothetical protein
VIEAVKNYCQKFCGIIKTMTSKSNNSSQVYFVRNCSSLVFMFGIILCPAIWHFGGITTKWLKADNINPDLLQPNPTFQTILKDSQSELGIVLGSFPSGPYNRIGIRYSKLSPDAAKQLALNTTTEFIKPNESRRLWRDMNGYFFLPLLCFIISDKLSPPSDESEE